MLLLKTVFGGTKQALRVNWDQADVVVGENKINWVYEEKQSVLSLGSVLTN